MTNAVQILWSPAWVTLSALDPLELVDVTGGDTPSLRMPVRMLSVDTPEVTARTDQRPKPSTKSSPNCRVDRTGSCTDLPAAGPVPAT
jgi:hypothetical protein